MSPSDPDHLLNKKNRNGETPLYVASRGGNLSVSIILMLFYLYFYKNYLIIS